MTTPTLTPITLFHYTRSPWSQKLVSYLNIRRIPYTSCQQPMMPPRPDLNALGVTYRRVPVLAIGRDMYCTVALAMEKLDSLMPYAPGGPDLRAKTPEGKALGDMLRMWVDAVVTKANLALLPATNDAIFGNEVFVRDRSALLGREFSAEAQRMGRAEALVTVRSCFEWLEDRLLADGREWLLGGGEGPLLADLHTAWTFAWLSGVPGGYEGDLTRESGRFPKTWAWIDRYSRVVVDAKENADVREVDGEVAVRQVLGSSYAEDAVFVHENNPLGLKNGDQVCGWPTDTGFTHKDQGKLVGLTSREAVIETIHGTRIHHPRYLFKVEKTC